MTQNGTERLYSVL